MKTKESSSHQSVSKVTTLSIILLLVISCLLLVSCNDRVNDVNKHVSTIKQVIPSPTPTLPLLILSPGWSSIGQFSGRGSVTYTNINIPISKLWGALFSCRGTGKANITLIPGKGGSFSVDCSSTSTGIDYAALMDHTNVIHQIKIAIDASSRWQLKIKDCTSDEHTCGVDPATPIAR